MITVRGHELKNLPSEMTIGHFEKLCELTGRKVYDPQHPENDYHYEDHVSKWEEVFVFSGLPQEEFDKMDSDELGKAVKEFNSMSETMDVKDAPRVLMVGGKTYKVVGFEDGEEFKLLAKDQKRIKQFMNANPNRCIAEMIAVIFQDTELTDAEHKADAHVKHKANIFRKELPAINAVPYIMFITKKIVAYNMYLMEEEKQENESSEGVARADA